MDTYKATNTTNGKFYIGSTTNFEKRKKDHLCSSLRYPFQNALRKNPEAFEWEVWSDDSDEPILEQALLDMWFGKECCYNMNPSAQHPPSWKGKRHKQETKDKQSETKKGDQNPAKRPEVRQKMSDSHRGVPLSDATREAMSIAGKGRPKTEEHKQKLRESNLGQTRSDEAREKMRKAHLGKKTWVNEQGDRKYQAESPGPEWQNGRKWKG
jgi:group I intron endonuclease